MGTFSSTRSHALAIAVSAGTALLLLVGAAVCNQASASAPKPLRSRQVTKLAGFIAQDLPTGSQFYVAPNGRASGAGSFDDPWDLATALAQPVAVAPGDTIWLRGGTYNSGPSGLVSKLTGSAARPIVVRSYPGELARIDGAATVSSSASSPGFILTVNGSYAQYRDLEVMSSSNPTPDGGQGSRPEGLQVVASNNKFINLIVHDTGQGFGFWEGASNSEITGCLIYYNGNSSLDHGIYANNTTGTKVLSGNVLFRNYGLGIHAYTTNGQLVNFDIERNVSFDNGKLNQSTRYQPNFLLGSGKPAATSCDSSAQVAQNPRFIDNMSYHPRGTGGRELDLGYSTGSCNPVATGNYLVGDTTLTLGPAFGTITIAGNTFYGSVAGFSTQSYPSNSYISDDPAATQIFVISNSYEPGRASIIIYNWPGQSTALVDVSSILTPGSAFEVRDAQNYLGTPVLSGTFTGGPLTLPLSGLTPASPVGLANPGATGPEFNVFVLVPRGPGRASVSPAARTPAGRPRPVPTRPP